MNYFFCRVALFFYITNVISIFLIPLLPILSFDFLMPMSLPFVAKESTLYIPVNHLQQTYSYMLVNGFIYTDFLIFYSILTHIMQEMDIMIDISKKIGEYEEVESHKSIVNGKVTDTNDAFLNILMEINENCQNNDKPTANQLQELILKRHVVLVNVIKIARSFYLVNILIWELIAFCTIIYLYYLIVHIGGNYLIAFGCVFLILQYNAMCYAGGDILIKEDEIARGLYGSKWYYLTGADRKHLCLILMMAQKPCTLSAGGFGNVSLKRFTSVRTP